MLFTLNFDGGMECPHCKTSIGVKWETEYGDPLIGEHEAECPQCEKKFNFSVFHEYTTWR